MREYCQRDDRFKRIKRDERRKREGAQDKFVVRAL